MTGAAGFAGRHLLEHLLEREPQVVAWRRRDEPGAPVLSHDGRVRWRTVDVTDGASVARALDAAPPSAIYHCAGFADVQRAWTDAAAALRVNVMGTHTVLGALARQRIDAPVLITGSALVYRPSLQPLSEEHPIGPSGPYAVSKLAQEMVAGATPGRVVIARPFNHAGPGQSDAYVTSSFARQIAEAEAGLRPAVLRVGNLDSQRDITDVRDTVRAYPLLLEHGEAGARYNVCRGQAYRVGALLDALVERSTTPIAIEVDPARLRASDNPVVLGSPARLHAATGWTAQFPIERTLEDLLDYWRKAVRQGARP